MLRRLEEHPRQPNWLAALLSPAAMASVPWFDWALLAALVVGVCLFPARFRSGSITSDVEDTMNTYPYLRAYMAGITMPGVALLIVLSSF